MAAYLLEVCESSGWGLPDCTTEVQSPANLSALCAGLGRKFGLAGVRLELFDKDFAEWCAVCPPSLLPSFPVDHPVRAPGRCEPSGLEDLAQDGATSRVRLIAAAPAAPDAKPEAEAEAAAFPPAATSSVAAFSEPAANLVPPSYSSPGPPASHEPEPEVAVDELGAPTLPVRSSTKPRFDPVAAKADGQTEVGHCCLQHSRLVACARAVADRGGACVQGDSEAVEAAKIAAVALARGASGRRGGVSSLRQTADVLAEGAASTRAANAAAAAASGGLAELADPGGAELLVLELVPSPPARPCC